MRYIYYVNNEVVSRYANIREQIKDDLCVYCNCTFFAFLRSLSICLLFSLASISSGNFVHINSWSMVESLIVLTTALEIYLHFTLVSWSDLMITVRWVHFPISWDICFQFSCLSSQLWINGKTEWRFVHNLCLYILFVLSKSTLHFLCLCLIKFYYDM